MRVLLTNDDGPPSAAHSPFVFGLWSSLIKLGWDVRVVLPSSQKSWIGKAFHIQEITKGCYFYPKLPHGHGLVSDVSRPLQDGELAEWILLDGTPATCANVALHNLYPGEIDLVISGPNLGRNTSVAFSMSSGTIGAAMSAALSGTRAIAVSYGIVSHPSPPEFVQPAHELSCRIIQSLYNQWGTTDESGLVRSDLELYSVNVPLVATILETGDNGMQVRWTTLWRNSYARLFRPVILSPESAGPVDDPTQTGGTLAFQWAPSMTGLLTPDPTSLPVQSDAYAFAQGHASITPLSASFAEPTAIPKEEDRVWKMKL